MVGRSQARARPPAIRCNASSYARFNSSANDYVKTARKPLPLKTNFFELANKLAPIFFASTPLARPSTASQKPTLATVYELLSSLIGGASFTLSRREPPFFGARLFSTRLFFPRLPRPPGLHKKLRENNSSTRDKIRSDAHARSELSPQKEKCSR